jgi:CTP synthase (UTP-ammonia lyase)
MEKRNKEKIMVEYTVFQKQRSTDDPFKWKDIKDIEFQDEDEIYITLVEAYYSENNSYDSHIMATVTRERLETDSEFEKRQRTNKLQDKFLKERRYETYLKLKKEFESQ